MKLPNLVLVTALASATAIKAHGEPAKPALLTVDLTVSGVAYTFKGTGDCTHTPSGTIFETPSMIWHAEQQAGDRMFNFTLFRLKSGGEMFTLLVGMGGKYHHVTTAKIGQKGNLRGTGKASFAQVGAGGSFTVDATAENGARIVGRITCSAFGTDGGNG